MGTGYRSADEFFYFITVNYNDDNFLTTIIDFDVK